MSDHLEDRKNPRNATNAGFHFELLFAYSTLCKAHDLLEHDIRLDMRLWSLSDLKPLAREDQFGAYAFRDGVDHAIDKLTRLYKLKFQREIYQNGRGCSTDCVGEAW
ncbi:hypothetical protein BKA63DRAFT_572138 [Paraphoma chrysanthemicola]|jgi:hypothetical protein|nr:hypothetical protein BKA63DRAFT_572138 [Paraphoma chrysanthemicola]